ncbi:N-dimethylarginine dimethylaminohydrolase [Scopulibacillus darangshiensis]|uniref:N-dimethylarginine dimethylaminohydrolase n=1 Tax=Scopulibacillus darangshiensis TaxID=442528 RepID=A0A4R2P658_9BACL|nr:dimethylarginine dimethylaminohydrolase family protein [Scopulibacillus darangshiensis]TCP29624.1 N-dimethylarginine dimethylaminohydrolase [Scopulibacillus darangshiensis]
MDFPKDSLSKVTCHNEYGTLQRVLLCTPQFMEIKEVINETQERFVNDDINSLLAVEQHESLIKVLEKENIDVILLTANEKFPEQVFTRDIGFTVGETLFLANMKRKVRQNEDKTFAKWLTEHGISFESIKNGSIEGGDVIVDSTRVWVGSSDRTSMEAIDELRGKSPGFEITAVPFMEEYLHLDCVFNIISPNEALIYPKAFDRNVVNTLSSCYDLIDVSSKEQFTLGTNILSIGNRTVISLPINKEVNKKLRRRGFSVVEVDISEIIKSGGSFRCITLPLIRE